MFTCLSVSHNTSLSLHRSTHCNRTCNSKICAPMRNNARTHTHCFAQTCDVLKKIHIDVSINMYICTIHRERNLSCAVVDGKRGIYNPFSYHIRDWCTHVFSANCHWYSKGVRAQAQVLIVIDAVLKRHQKEDATRRVSA